MTVQLRCHHCGGWLGESSNSLTMVGIFKNPPDREYVAPPRETYRCKGCGWVNVFQVPAVRDYRNIELKAS